MVVLVLGPSEAYGAAEKCGNKHKILKLLQKSDYDIILPNRLADPLVMELLKL